MKKLLITGYSGFVGGHLLRALENEYTINLLGRSTGPKCNKFLKANIDSQADYSSILESVDVVIHIAARVHVMTDAVNNPLEEYRAVNTAGTLNLAKQAAAAGVKRFIFVSSIKVNGESTTDKPPFNIKDIPSPNEPYGESKAEAEKQLLALSNKVGMEVVIIRPPLIYGEGVKGNFESLIRLVNIGTPLPFGLINKNKRSLVSIINLVDLIKVCIHHPKAADQVFFVSDDHDISTSAMVRQIAIALDKSIWQLPIPVWCYQFAGKLFGKSDVIDRLIGSLQVDITYTKETLGWKPPQSLEEGFRETTQALLNNKK